jgi:hypothetical protein
MVLEVTSYDSDTAQSDDEKKEGEVAVFRDSDSVFKISKNMAGGLVPCMVKAGR